MHILLVEDCVTDQEIVRDCVERCMPLAKLTVRSDCVELLALLGAYTIDVILLDYQLPTASGLGVLNALKNNAQNRFPPIVMLTGVGDEAVAVEAMKLGASDYISKNELTAELLLKRINAAVDGHALAEEIRRHNKLLSLQSMIDAQTGLRNATAFEDRLEHLIDSAERYDRRFALMFFDLTSLDAAMGVSAVDEAVREVAGRLRSIARRSDLVFRVGSDRFAMLLELKKSSRYLRRIAKRASQLMSAPVPCREGSLEVCISIGAATYPESAWESTGLIRGAERALQRSIASGSGFELAAARDGAKKHWFKRREDVA